MPSNEWVLLRRYDDGLNAQIALDFLRDHGVPVALRGNSGATAVLNRFDTVLDVRIVVRQEHLADALEALEALESPSLPIESREELAPVSGHPYRDTSGRHEISPRYRRAAFALAFMLPIGSGHFYAGENIAGAVFASSLAACVLSGFLVARSEGPAAAAILIITLDALTCSFAVARHNAGAPAPQAHQALRAMACVAFAFAVASLMR